MKNINPKKGLINEINDMREMVRNLEKSRHTPQQIGRASCRERV